jgi:yecA family protein
LKIKGKTMRRHHTPLYGYTPTLLLPPNLETVGPVPFAAQDFAKLDAWLAEQGWPDGRMDVAALEGYLVALLSWPIELGAGAWLPPIWGIRGWKVAAKIASPESYDQFIALIIGLFQELEHRLSSSPPARTFVLGCNSPYLSGRYFAGAAWATGFLTALHENSMGLGGRSSAVRSAVEDIAHFAPLRSIQARALPAVATALSVAVMTIMSERPLPGPIAAVPSKIATSPKEKIAANRQLESINGDESQWDMPGRTAEETIGDAQHANPSTSTHLLDGKCADAQ